MESTSALSRMAPSQPADDDAISGANAPAELFPVRFNGRERGVVIHEEHAMFLGVPGRIQRRVQPRRFRRRARHAAQPGVQGPLDGDQERPASAHVSPFWRKGEL